MDLSAYMQFLKRATFLLVTIILSASLNACKFKNNGQGYEGVGGSSSSSGTKKGPDDFIAIIQELLGLDNNAKNSEFTCQDRSGTVGFQINTSLDLGTFERKSALYQRSQSDSLLHKLAEGVIVRSENGVRPGFFIYDSKDPNLYKVHLEVDGDRLSEGKSYIPARFKYWANPMDLNPSMVFDEFYCQPTGEIPGDEVRTFSIASPTSKYGPPILRFRGLEAVEIFNRLKLNPNVRKWVDPTTGIDLGTIVGENVICTPKIFSNGYNEAGIEESPVCVMGFEIGGGVTSLADLSVGSYAYKMCEIAIIGGNMINAEQLTQSKYSNNGPGRFVQLGINVAPGVLPESQLEPITINSTATLFKFNGFDARSVWGYFAGWSWNPTKNHIFNMSIPNARDPAVYADPANNVEVRVFAPLDKNYLQCKKVPKADGTSVVSDDKTYDYLCELAITHSGALQLIPDELSFVQEKDRASSQR